MKQEFLDFINALMEAAPKVAEEKMTDNVKKYIESFTNDSSIKEKPEITDNGKIILKFFQSHPVAPFKAKEIAEELFISSRTISGAMRKLVTDGFVEKVGEQPALYTLTEKGKNFVIEE